MQKRLKKTIAYLAVYFIVMQLFMSGTLETYAAGNDVEKSDRIIVSMGDSYSSGEGLGDYGYSSDPKDKIKDANWLGHRSNNAWSGQLTLGKGKSKITMSGSRYSVSNPDGHWYFVASSGAETKHIINDTSICSDSEVVSGQELNELKKGGESGEGYQKKEYSISGLNGKKYIRPQLSVFDELEKQGKKADFITLTIGGNDLGFVDIAKGVLGKVMYIDIAYTALNLADALAKIKKGGEVRKNIKSTYKAILKRAGSQSKLIVAGYPKLFNASLLFDGIGVSKGDSIIDCAVYNIKALEVNAAITLFNKTLQEIVNECNQDYKNQIYFVSVEEKFNNHGAYAMNTPFINKVYTYKQANNDDINNDIISAKSMHPNEKGAQAYAEAVQAKINSLESKRNIEISDEDDFASYDTSGDYDSNGNLIYTYVVSSVNIDTDGTSEDIVAENDEANGYLYDIENPRIGNLLHPEYRFLFPGIADADYYSVCVYNRGYRLPKSTQRVYYQDHYEVYKLDEYGFIEGVDVYGDGKGYEADSLQASISYSQGDNCWELCEEKTIYQHFMGGSESGEDSYTVRNKYYYGEYSGYVCAVEGDDYNIYYDYEERGDLYEDYYDCRVTGYTITRSDGSVYSGTVSYDSTFDNEATELGTGWIYVEGSGLPYGCNKADIYMKKGFCRKIVMHFDSGSETTIVYNYERVKLD